MIITFTLFSILSLTHSTEAYNLNDRGETFCTDDSCPDGSYKNSCRECVNVVGSMEPGNAYSMLQCTCNDRLGRSQKTELMIRIPQQQGRKIMNENGVLKFEN